MENKPQITFDEFLAIEAKLEIKIGRITAIERVPKSKKLLKLTVDFRYDSTETKTVVTATNHICCACIKKAQNA